MIQPSLTRGWIRVHAAAQTPYSELIRVLDTLRERTHKFPGCALRSNRFSGVWYPGRHGLSSCMFPFPVLGKIP